MRLTALGILATAVSLRRTVHAYLHGQQKDPKVIRSADHGSVIMFIQLSQKRDKTQKEL